MFTIPPIVITILEIILAAMGAFLVVFWFALVVWTFQDVRRRTHDVLVQLLALLLVLVFNIAGLVVYLIIRPQETLATVVSRQIEEEALLQEMEEKLGCPHCHKATRAEFAVCPHCGERLKRACSSCGQLLALNWLVCPYCETPVTPDEPKQLPAPAAVAAPEPAQAPPDASSSG